MVRTKKFYQFYNWLLEVKEISQNSHRDRKVELPICPYYHH